jgi:hypothetical protein
MESESGTSPWSVGARRLPTGIVEVLVGAELSQWPDLHKRLARQSGYLLCNLRRGRVTTLPDLEVGESVLAPQVLEQLPPDLLANDSLHLVGLPETPGEELTNATSSLLQADAGCLILSDLDRAALCEQLQMYWAWLLRPSTLKLQLLEGSQHLAERLVNPEIEYLTWSPQQRAFAWYLPQNGAEDRTVCLREKAEDKAEDKPDDGADRAGFVRDQTRDRQ